MAINKSIKLMMMALIRGYRYAISALFGNVCRFEPSCSHYALLAIEQHGSFKGCFLAVKRLLRCHPWHAGGMDPVPKGNNNTNI